MNLMNEDILKLTKNVNQVKEDVIYNWLEKPGTRYLVFEYKQQPVTEEEKEAFMVRMLVTWEEVDDLSDLVIEASEVYDREHVKFLLPRHGWKDLKEINLHPVTENEYLELYKEEPPEREE